MPYLSGYEAPSPLLGSPPPPPPDPPPPRPESGPRVGGTRRMARCYAPPPVFFLWYTVCGIAINTALN